MIKLHGPPAVPAVPWCSITHGAHRIGVDYAGDASPPDFVMIHFVPTTTDYYTGFLNAVERSVHLNGLFTTSGTVAKYKWPMKWKTKDFLLRMSLVSLLK